jgi:hypothetical protein
VYTFLARFTPQPSPAVPQIVWSKFYGGDMADDTASAQPTSVAIAKRTIQPFDDVLIAGSYRRSVDFGTGTVAGGADPALFVVRVAP